MTIKALENTYLSFLFLVYLGLGFFGAIYYVQHETQFKRPVYSTAEIRRNRLLFRRLHKAEYKNAHLESEIEEMNLRTATMYEDTAYGEVERLSQLIGLLQQEGPGVEVTVKDSEKPLLLGDNANTGIVHNTDLVQIVNALKAAGASSVAINDQPITNMTGINCSGPIILINGTRVTSPFRIDALAKDPEGTVKNLQTPNSFLKELEKYGIPVAITTKDVVIPAYSQDSTQL
jgi:uncharacterized protein YlxW (UPF0749 family)